VLEDAAGLAEFAQNFADVVKFLGLHEATGPTLAPGELVERLDRFLSTASRLITQMPA